MVCASVSDAVSVSFVFTLLFFARLRAARFPGNLDSGGAKASNDHWWQQPR